MSEPIAAEASGIRPRASDWVSTARRLLVARGDDLRLALGALNGHKLRSGLTLLGIVIGVFTVVAMMALLNGLSGSINKQMGALGADVFEIQRWPAVQFGPLSPEVWARKKITLANVLQLREMLPQAKQVGGDIWDWGKTVTAGDNTDHGTQIAGGTTELFTNNNLPLASGRPFTEPESLDAARVAVIGAAAADAPFPGPNPLRQKIQLGRLRLEGVATLQPPGALPVGANPDNTVPLPLSL